VGERDLLIVAAVVAAVAVLSRLAGRRLRLPEAIPLVLLGLAAGLLPGVPAPQLAPDLVLLLFLPPLIYHAAFETGPRETRFDAVGIGLLAVPLTLATTAAVAAVLRLVLPDLGWAVALAFGAAVAPTDAVAVTAVLERLGAPVRLVSLLQGESLINDAVALTVFGLAVESVVTPLNPAHGLLRLALVVLGGPALGLLVGWLVGAVRGRATDPGIQVLISVATPYLAYLPAQELGASGVLATVTAGLYLGSRTEGLLPPSARLAGQAFWRVLIFLLESTLFVLLGLQIRGIAGRYGQQHGAGTLLAAFAVVLGALVAVRLAWALLVPAWRRLVPGRWLRLERLGWRQRLVVGWAGVHGAICLAVVLSLPARAGGRPFPERATLVLLAAGVVLVTLVVPPTTMPVLLRAFGLREAGRRRERETRARIAMAEAGLTALDRLAERGRVDEATADAYRQLLQTRLEHLSQLVDDGSHDRERPHASELRHELADAQRRRLDELYRDGDIDDGIRRTLSREVDLDRPDARHGLVGGG
jgi:Na+/H+ antiporter